MWKFPNFEATMMLQGCLGKIHKLPSHKIRTRLYMVLHHLILWVKPKYFRPRYFRDFLETVWVEKGLSGAIFWWPIRAGRKSPPFPHIYLFIAVIITWVLFSLIFSQNCYLCHRLESRRDLLCYALSKSPLSKVSSIFAIFKLHY
jgi:hypothetical protein